MTEPEDYESSREPLVQRSEHDQSTKHRLSMQTIGLLFVVISMMILSGLVWLAIGRTVEPTTIDQPSGPKLERVEPPSTYLPGNSIALDLPTKIDELNQSLGLPGRVNFDVIPATNIVAVAMIDLSERGRGQVDYNGDVEFTAASTYKLFVAYAMVNAVESGRMGWASQLNGTTLDECFRRMIVESDNDCPEVYLKQAGFSKTGAQMHALGLSERTRFTTDSARTTANDLALFLKKLHDGELMSVAHQQKLLDLMKRQIYRQGMPTGIQARTDASTESSNTVVANKVGFLDELLHDAGIIYSPRGDYVLVIMTNGESWPFIAQLAAWIDGQMV